MLASFTSGMGDKPSSYLLEPRLATVSPPSCCGLSCAHDGSAAREVAGRHCGQARTSRLPLSQNSMTSHSRTSGSCDCSEYDGRPLAAPATAYLIWRTMCG